MSAMGCLPLTLTILGSALAVVAALQGLWELYYKQRKLEALIVDARAALDRDNASGDRQLPELQAALGRDHVSYADILWLPELIVLRLSREQFRSLRIQSALIAMGVVLSTIGSLLGS